VVKVQTVKVVETETDAVAQSGGEGRSGSERAKLIRNEICKSSLRVALGGGEKKRGEH